MQMTGLNNVAVAAARLERAGPDRWPNFGKDVFEVRLDSVLLCQ
jgi:hypothetical protein